MNLNNYIIFPSKEYKIKNLTFLRFSHNTINFYCSKFRKRFHQKFTYNYNYETFNKFYHKNLLKYILITLKV